MFTGRRAFSDAKRDTLPSKPSSHVSGLSPAVEAVILRLSRNRPSRIGRNPRSKCLRACPAAIPSPRRFAAGQTPSPQLVADAGGSGVVSVRTGLLAFGA